MDPLVVPMGLLAGVGAILSHIMANRRVAKAQRQLVARHVRVISQLADAAIEVMAVEYGADLDDAMAKFMAAAKERNPTIIGVPGDLAAARAHIEKLRAERKEKASDTKQDG